MKHLPNLLRAALLATTSTVFATPVGPLDKAINLASPSGALTAKLGTTATGQLAYTVSLSGTIVVDPSPMGITISGTTLGAESKLGKPSTTTIDEQYPILGNSATATNHAHSYSIPVTSGNTTFILEARCYDNAFAWRYRVPGSGIRTVNGETSSFRIPAKSKVWFFERRNAWKLKSYAGEWLSADIDEMPDISPTGPVQGFPLVYELPAGGYGILCEAAVFNYSGMRAKATGNRTFTADFTEAENGFPLAGEILTPWRVVIAVPDLNELVNQTVLTNLAPAPDPELFADSSWIRPGWSVWRWQLQGVGRPKAQEKFVKYAQKLGYPYSLIDDGWELYWDKPFEDLKGVVKEGKKRGVDIFVWKRWGDVRDPADNFASLRLWLDKVAATGVVGIKMDFFDCEDLPTRLGEEAVLREAARRKLMVNFHGCPKPTGESRTYPNEITREGIRGIELNFIKSEGCLPASHNAALPFTRLALGHGDYTPITFQPGHLGETTIAHQLATAVAYLSPVQYLNEIPGNLIDYPVPEVTDFMKSLPTVWDETRVLPGSKIGDLAVIARRKDTTWYVAALNGASARTYALDLSFLNGNPHTTLLLADVPKTQTSIQKIKPTDDETTLNIPLNKGGGFVARFTERGL